MRVDVDDVGVGSRSIGFQVNAIPAFVPLDAEGRATGKILDGGAWDETTAQNVTDALARLLSG